MTSPVDVVVLIPFQPGDGVMLDPLTRRSLGVHFASPLVRALNDAQEHVGRPLYGYTPVFSDGTTLPWAIHRSLSAVALATILEEAGLRWHILDPGPEEQLSWWRRELMRLVDLDPPLVGICSTFVLSGQWLRMLIALVRRYLPRAKIAVGGYYYATDTQDFLRLNVDILFVGEGEVRFPQLVRAVKDGGRGLRDIPGLYLRRPDGRLDYTGSPDALDLAKNCRPNYKLAPRIYPPVDLEENTFDVGVETQRGCVFKCEFCTWRTLAAPNVMSPDDAVDRIMDTGVVKQGSIGMIDATATFPHKRWRDILERVVERGGAPHPIWALARVSDLDDSTAELMSRANVRLLTIGQESGDQRVLDLMRKGTKVQHIAPAMQACAKHKISVCMAMIVGFPGENEESIANTRRVLCEVNAHSPDEPPVLLYRITPFFFQDFATVAVKKKETQDQGFPYGNKDFTVEQSSREALRSVIAISKIPHAPSWGFSMNHRCLTSRVLTGPYRFEVHRAMKALDRTISIFLEHREFGTPLAGFSAELRALREELHERQPHYGPLQRAKVRARARIGTHMLEALKKEWVVEKEGDAGTLTRLVITAKALRDTGNLRDSAASYRAGTYAPDDVAPATSAEVVQEIAAQAGTLISVATLKAKTAKLPRTA